MGFLKFNDKRKTLYKYFMLFQECLKDIEASLNIIENSEINEQEFSKGHLIVKLLKRRIECLMAFKQFKTAKTNWENILELSKNVYKIPLPGQWYKKYFIIHTLFIIY